MGFRSFVSFHFVYVNEEQSASFRFLISIFYHWNDGKGLVFNVHCDANELKTKSDAGC